MPNRADDWLDQARRNLDQAEASRQDDRHEWACFAAQQAAELAAKALHLHLGQEAWGHVVAKLLVELPLDVPGDLVEKAKVVDNFYIPTRSPNGHSDRVLRLVRPRGLGRRQRPRSHRDRGPLGASAGVPGAGLQH